MELEHFPGEEGKQVSNVSSEQGVQQKVGPKNKRKDEAFWAERPFLSALPFLGISLFCIGLLLFFHSYAFGYHVVAGGEIIGSVSSRAMVEDSIVQVEENVSSILNRDYQYQADLDLQFTCLPREELMGYTQLGEELMQGIPEIKPAYALTVDGEEVGVSAEKGELENLLNRLQAQYTTQQTKAVFFLNEPQIELVYIPAQQSYSDLEELSVAILAPRPSVEGVTLVKPEVTHLLADMSSPVSDRSPVVNQMVFAASPSPRLSVCTVDQIAYVKAIDSPVREIEDATLYEGESKIIVQGQEGKQEVVSSVTYLNGEILQEVVLEENILTQATQTVKAVGTKERPKYYSTGELQWPCQGNITSTFGNRYIFGSSSFHAGLDIANDRGTALYAADSGYVTFVDYKGSYGNMVIIDHGNGMETVYAHCDTTSVSVGQGVEQGQLVGTMGTSGRATGNHCHFEVRLDGTAVNPQEYLP